MELLDDTLCFWSFWGFLRGNSFRHESRHVLARFDSSAVAESKVQCKNTVS